MTTTEKGPAMQVSLGTVPINNKRLCKFGTTLTIVLACVFWLNIAGAQESSSQPDPIVDEPILLPVEQASAIPDSDLAAEMETLKQALVNLNRDLFILEEDLLFPSSTQVAVYLSMDVGEYFKLDAVELKVDGKLATYYLYTDRQVNALYKGGVQRLFVGNINQGAREISAFFIGTGPENRAYKRAVTLEFDKDEEAATVELKIIDSTSKQQPTFSATLL
jgi:hypothetical protein